MFEFNAIMQISDAVYIIIAVLYKSLEYIEIPSSSVCAASVRRLRIVVGTLCTEWWWQLLRINDHQCPQSFVMSIATLIVCDVMSSFVFNQPVPLFSFGSRGAL